MDTLRQEDWDWVIGVSQLGVLHGIQAFLPRIKAHGEGGHVVNTASMAGLVNPDPEWGPYNSTKFAVVSMSEILRRELQDTNIGVSVLCPGPVHTNILDIEARTDTSGRAGIKVTVQITDVKHLEKVMKSLRGVKGVASVARARAGADGTEERVVEK